MRYKRIYKKVNIHHCVKSVQMRSFFWSAFSRIRTIYGEIWSIFPYSVRKNFVFRHFSRRECIIGLKCQLYKGLKQYCKESRKFCFNYTARKMKLSIHDFFSKCDLVRRKLRIWSHLLKNSLMENFIFLCVKNWYSYSMTAIFW